MARSSILLAVIAVTICCTSASAVRCAEPEKASPARDDAFAGKLVYVYSRSTTEYTNLLEKVQVRNLGGKPFLVGTAVDDGESGNWVKGRTIWIPMDDVSQLVEFPSLEEYKKSAGEYKKGDVSVKR